MGLKAYFDVMKYKVSSLFSRRSSFSATVFGSRIGKYAVIKNHSRFYGSILDEYSFIGRNCLVQKAEIGKFVSIADGCNIGLPAHDLNAVSTSPVFFAGKNAMRVSFSNRKQAEAPVTVIGNDVWIGAGVMIKAGVKIGDGAVIGAGAVVTHDVPPYEIWAGTPAKLIRKRFDESTIQKLLDLKWWEWDQKTLRQYAPAFESPEKLLEAIGSTDSEQG
ncbi:MAG: CatB-related O-acetyltransferase [Ruminococcaceae bacterium]|nr:CatB-related O-acetyltransferase [Oscillospiraceae bacterium]